MKAPKLALAVGYIDDDLVSDAVDYLPVQRKNKIRYWKYATVVAACIVVALGINGYLKKYAITNDIHIEYDVNEQFDNADGSMLSHDDVTPEMAEKGAKANNIHNLIIGYNFEWYGNCYYDYDSDLIMIGLTENTEINQKKIVEIIGDIAVQFFECEHSYHKLEKIYNKLESRQFLLMIIGVKRYNISVVNNYVNVCITSEKNHLAIYVVNKLADEDGAVSFKVLSDQPAADREENK
ncbi:MAG: hypothetical protein J6B37_04285 [Clostridia bacterium]|nr:hypothetical protein [Clostridia bacterium]